MRRIGMLLVLIIAAGGLASTAFTAAPAWANPDLICHGTGSATSPFVLIDVPTNSAHFTKHLPAGRDVRPTFVNGVPNCPTAAGALAPTTLVPSGPFDEPVFESVGFAQANGGNAASVRGGDGGRGGTGVAPQCNQNTNDSDWWDEPAVDCGAGGRGGVAGDGGISDGGDGGLAFAIAFG